MKKNYRLLIGILTVLLAPTFTSAHPGNTAADGCHYCRTNCDKWGVAWNERHCHGGSTTPAPTPTYTAPTTYTPPVVKPAEVETPVLSQTPVTQPKKENNAYGYGTTTGANKVICASGSIVSTDGTSCIKIITKTDTSVKKTVVKKLVCKKGYTLSKTGKSCVKKK